jgi:hypothetical protein
MNAFESLFIIAFYYMASITSGEMVDCDWLRSTFSGPLFPRNVDRRSLPKNKRMHFTTKQQN